ncbi:hypothetical protein BMT54_08375 [Pasteurellaceae bacterium 15-036681]|nr:hypothetical protein BMT54_08375 [Pasteurellaceae bacterium 15-036681]
MTKKVEIHFVVTNPVMTFEQYSRCSGMSKALLEDLAKSGDLPVMPKSKEREEKRVNVVKHSLHFRSRINRRDL